MRASFAVLLCAMAVTAADSRDEVQQLVAQLETLRAEYNKQQSVLQGATSERWQARQRQVAQKEGNKQSLDDVRQEMERLYADVARAREEVLARENALADEAEKLRGRQEEWRYVGQAVREKLDKASSSATAGFPLDREADMAALAAITMRMAGDPRFTHALDSYVAYHLARIRYGARLGLSRRTFVVGSNEPVTAQVLRVGQCMAYALSPDGVAYFLGGSGRVGADAFVWHRMGDPQISVRIAAVFPTLIETRQLQASLPVDVLQNRYSQSLLSGERQDWTARARTFMRAGGPILIPLVLVVLWALFIVVNRLLTYSARHRRGYRFINDAVGLLEEGEMDDAASLAARGKGVLSGILGECLKHRRWSRSSAEKAVRELLLAEVPLLDRHLDTLAVLAAAAPLLGLLGTVTGMIRMFEAITRFGTGDPKLLAGGISEALITTEVGLAIAIPTLLLHNFLRNRRNRIQSDMEMYAMRILNRLWSEE